ncbi:MAG: pyridoxamine 5'-phosphate oxidase family protein [Ardenticatenaceae bacterium]|nr:pyridoxamine 5'-phosphate oxidase family protein [Anaerolineales bacterium]MCB8921108.1 pyridoxamine 5'-phosphate oxidase family protein [Ardenticatenaceae bacterium]MCB8990813.1 pyridoxamine 5'-phosphate oxidase family protein [Ardenticatenaceae bacterium]MCB9004493.1 pyridoxamine 5'-phosphate oxidase family protein [Ardenticatenaceae bacterium]
MKRRNPARWRAVEARLGREPTIWVATVRYDGRPHLVPVWFIWLQEKIYISTGAETQKFLNLTVNGYVSLALPDTAQVIVIEGEAAVADWQTVDTVADYFYHKYEWDFRYDDSADWRLIEITPKKILSWGDDYQTEGIRVF